MNSPHRAGATHISPCLVLLAKAPRESKTEPLIHQIELCCRLLHPGASQPAARTAEPGRAAT